MKSTKQLVICALFVVLGIVFPMLFHTVGLGAAFLPMHIPVFLCAFICGPAYGVAGAVCTVFLSSVLTGMPPLFPVGVTMMIELAVYAGVAGMLMRGKKYTLTSLYLALAVAVILGRIANGIANVAVLGISGGAYSFQAFISGSVLATIPGTVLIFLFVPSLVKLIEKAVKLHD